MDDEARAGITVARRHAAGVITLARPEHGNALNSTMREVLAATYPELARDPIIYAAIIKSGVPGMFCPGADLAELVALADADAAASRAEVAAQVRLYWLHECFSKPTVALIDGAVAGSGAGVSFHGTHRVAGERFSFSCPETGFGLVPMGGVARALALMPDQVGVYLALSGQAIGRADAYRLGLVTHCFDADRFDEIERHLGDADPVDAPLDTLHVDPGEGVLENLREPIARCFSAGSIAEIVGRLAGEPGTYRPWADAARAALEQRSPLALKVTHRFLQRVAHLDLRQSLVLEYNLTCRLMDGPDFKQAMRARSASGRVGPWQPGSLAQVDEATVVALLDSEAVPPLDLPTREQMQGRRS